MLHSVALAVGVHVRMQCPGIDSEVVFEELQKIRLLLFVQRHKLDAVAGGENHALLHAGRAEQLARDFRQCIGGNRQAFTDLNRCSFMVDPPEHDLHGPGNLWTELNRLAIQTLTTTTNAKLDT